MAALAGASPSQLNGMGRLEKSETALVGLGAQLCRHEASPLRASRARSMALRLRGGVRELESEEEWEEILRDEERLVVVDFTASWCGPCQRIAPAYAALAEEFGGALFVKIDVDVLGELAADLGVASMPTFQLYRHGELVDTLRGANEPALRMLLEQHI
uniref:Thioredoxin domain-containing protein n=1 Tax=Coccolithus braarudii TaxID=221442 RepID=A0A7S0PX45_9EUKA